MNYLMILNYVLIGLCLSGSGIATALCERNKEGEAWIYDWDLLEWAKKKGKFAEWLIRVPFSFSRDLWHCLKSLSTVLTLMAFTQNFFVIVAYYTIGGLVFNLAYANKNDQKLTEEIL